MKNEGDANMKLLRIILCLVLAAALLGCTALADDVSALAGTYLLDASPLGMPLTVYLIIGEDGTFRLTNKPEGGADKGNGKIGSQDGLYLMVYSDSTNEQMKTATFTADGGKLVFSTAVPYGAASFSPNTEDPENPIYPVAKKIAYEEYLGEYVGSLEVQAMGSSIVYEVTVSLDYGTEYTLTSTFAMGGETYDFTQTGSFSIADGQISLDGREGQIGTIDENGMTVSAFLSAMASSPREISLQKALTADAAGEYLGFKDMSMMGFTVNASLVLDAVGGYVYTASLGEEDNYVLEGSFSCEDGVLVLNREDADALEGTLANQVIEIKVPISASVPMTTAIVFYGEAVQGEFFAETEAEDGSRYESALTLNPDATYTIAVKKDGEDAYQEAGTFAVEASMAGTSLVLTAQDGTVSTGMVSETINVNHNIDAAFNTLGFKYAK